MIKIDLTLIITVINFGILYFLLKKYLFDPLLNFVDKREEEILEGNKKALKVEEELKKIQETYSQKVNESKKEAVKIIASSNQKSWTMRKEKIDDIQKENLQLLTEASQALEEDTVETKNILKNTTSEFSFQVAEKILGRSLKNG